MMKLSFKLTSSKTLILSLLLEGSILDLQLRHLLLPQSSILDMQLRHLLLHLLHLLQSPHLRSNVERIALRRH